MVLHQYNNNNIIHIYTILTFYNIIIEIFHCTWLCSDNICLQFTCTGPILWYTYTEIKLFFEVCL